jgi:hypothetical protein
MNHALVLLLLFTLGLAWPSPTAAAEQRCNELGAACLCSERFNTNQFSTSNSTWMNPTDSNPKQCEEIGGTGTAVTPTNWSQHTGASVGLPQLSYVWATKSGWTFGRPITSATRRLAVRYYFRFSSDFQYGETGSCGSSKLSQIAWNATNQHTPEFQWAGLVGPKAPAIRVQGFSSNNYEAWNAPVVFEGGFTYDVCKTRWCRLEMIVSGDVLAGRNIFVEGSVVAVGTNQRAVTPRTAVGSASGSHSVVYPEPVNGFRGGSCAGTRYISHQVQAAWTSDAGQTIGAAREIESGGGGGDDTPPVPASPPAAPSNLRISSN